MNVLTIFDQRITAIFEAGAPGERLPFSFKRLAKRAVREMEDETFVIDGVDTAPALYTILISQTDDLLMQPLYLQITDEISQLIEAQAKKRGYTFVGRPLVRFMVDPALHAGRFSVFAENIDPRTLARLRDEENAYLGVTPPSESYAGQGFAPAPVPLHEEEPAPVAQAVAFVPEDEPEVDPFVPEVEIESEPFVPEVEAEPELEIEPEPFVAEAEPDLFPDEVAPVDSVPEIDPFEVVPEEYVAKMPSDLTEEPKHAAHAAAHVAPVAPKPAQEPVVAAMPTCTLIDLGSGRSYRITTSRAAIGRERIAGGVVLTDPNASRRHAELLFDGNGWFVRDLNSTNGTLVNDVDVPESKLETGDVLTIGLTNLEFRAG